MLKLSIVIPVYNVEKYLAKCLDSLLVPTEVPYEIIAVNDGSTDGSLTVAERYRERYPALITLITTENAGQGAARNVGLERARGEFLYFIDSDDYLAPGGMEGILSALSLNFDICIFDSIAVNAAGKELKYMPGCDREGKLNLTNHPALLTQGPDVWNKIIRRSLFIDNGLRFPVRVWFEDLATIPKLYQFTDRIVYLPKPWHRYLQRRGSATNSGKAMRNLEVIPAVDALWSFYRERGRFEELRPELEFLAFHEEFLTSSVRANLADRRSPAQETLLLDFLKKVPDYKRNPYYQKSSRKHHLLTWLLTHRRRLAVHALMKLNDMKKQKQY